MRLKAVIVSFICGLLILNANPVLAKDIHARIFENADYVLKIEVGIGHDEQSANGLITHSVNWVTVSGFVFEDKDGKWILTVSHFAQSKSNGFSEVEKILAYFRSGHKQPVELELVGYDTRLDVALMKFKDPESVAGYPVAKLGSSAQMLVGDEVIAIGMPAPVSVWSPTSGRINQIIAGINHNLMQPELIVHDATVSPGSSGSPLINIKEEVIGINTAFWFIKNNPFVKAFSLAIPIDDVKSVLPALKKGQSVAHPPTQLLMWPTGYLHQVHLDKFGITPQSSKAGFLIVAVGAGSNAEKLGLQVGDVVIAVNGKPIDDNANLTPQLIQLYKLLCLETDLTKKVLLTVDRHGTAVTFPLSLD